MKKSMIGIFILIVAVIGGMVIKGSLNTKSELVYNPLSEKENVMAKLDGNDICLYDLKNISADKGYMIELTYEVYEKGKLIKSDNLAGIGRSGSNMDGKREDIHVGINIQQDKIKSVLSTSFSESNGEIDIKEDLEHYSRVKFIENAPLELGTEMYIYYATAENGMKTIPIGVPIDKNTLDKILDKGKSEALIKLSFREE